MTTTGASVTRQAGITAAHPSTAARERTTATARVFFADHMRVALIALVVIHHLTIAFAIPLPGLWYYEDPTTSTVANVAGLFILLIDQAFFMGAFFLIAGYFTPSSYDRKGAGGFLRDRLIRLIVPLFAFDLVLGPLAEIPSRIEAHGHPSWGLYLKMTNQGPLWFAEVLFLLCCGYTAFRLLLRRPAPERAPGPAAPPTARAVLLFTVALATVTFVFRLIIPVGYWLPILNLPTPAYLPQYVSLFALGIVAARRGWFRSVPDWMGWTGLAISAVATVVLLLPALATGLKSGTFAGGMHWQAAAYALWDSTLSVGVFLGLLVAFRRWADRAGRLWDELSRNAFGVFVLHAPLIVGVTLVLIAVPLEPLLKLALAIVITLPLCFTVSGLVRRIPGVARVL